MRGIITLVLAIAIIFVAFKTNVWLGLASIVLVILGLFYLNRANYYAFQANAAHQQGNQELVLKYLKAATEVANCPPQHHLSYGYILLKNGEQDKAKEIFDNLLSKPLTKNIKMATEMNIAIIKWKRGQLDEAIELMENILSVYKTTDVYGTLGYLYIERGDAEKALAFNEEAYDYNADNGVITDNLAASCMMNDQEARATELLTALLEKSPSFPEPYVHYGQLLMKQQNVEEAINYFEKALEKNFHHLSTVTPDDIEQELSNARKQLGSQV